MAHDHTKLTNKKALFWAIVINIILTIVQVIGGILSGSLSLLADALHNFSDAGALIIAYLAEKVSGWSPNEEMTFGYGRAQILGALLNSVTLVIVGFYLIYEAWMRYFSPSKTIDGWMVIWVAVVALVIDAFTAWLTFSGSKESINMKAAFIHNMSDALASVVVIISGVLILNYQAFWVDLVATVIISLYVLYQSVGLIKSSVKTLMQAVPEDLSQSRIVEKIKNIEGVEDVHHVHLWAIYEKFRSLEAHIVVSVKDLESVEVIKKDIKQILKKSFEVSHSTLEFESMDSNCNENKKF